jgi:hypothetical protein
MTAFDLLKNYSQAEGTQTSYLLADLCAELSLTLLDTFIDILDRVRIKDTINLLNLRDRIIEGVEV